MFKSNADGSDTPDKSQIHSKRSIFHQKIAITEKQKMRRTARFQGWINELFQRNKIQKGEFILGLEPQQAQQRVRDMIKNQQLNPLVFSIINLRQSRDFQFILNQPLLQELVEFSVDRMNQPHVILIFRVLAQSHPTFHKVVFQRIQVVSAIVREIQSLKSSTFQDIYLDVLQHLAPKCSKRYQNQITQLFDVFSQMIQDQTIQFGPGLKIVKSISSFISQDKYFQVSTINRILDYYEGQMRSNVYSQLMVDCYVVLVKVIYYQKNVDVICNMRLIRIILHARQNLPAKVIYQFHSTFRLISILIKKTAQFQIQQISRTEFLEFKRKLIEDYLFRQILVLQKKAYLTSMIINQILEDNSNLLKFQFFEINYIDFVSKLTTYCNPQILLQFFIQARFLQFLAQCLTHPNIEINILTLESFYQIITSQSASVQTTLQILRTNCRLVDILQEKAHFSLNLTVAKMSGLILQRFDQFQGLI